MEVAIGGGVMELLDGGECRLFGGRIGGWDGRKASDGLAESGHPLILPWGGMVADPITEWSHFLIGWVGVPEPTLFGMGEEIGMDIGLVGLAWVECLEGASVLFTDGDFID